MKNAKYRYFGFREVVDHEIGPHREEAYRSVCKVFSNVPYTGLFCQAGYTRSDLLSNT